jgi:hypothetical protein
MKRRLLQAAPDKSKRHLDKPEHKFYNGHMAIINNLVISLINHQGFNNHTHARRVFNACPAKAFALICGL